MINITKDTIEFLTKDRRKRKSDKSKVLLQGLTCPQCSNIIYASFLTDKEIDLWNYEETSVLKTRGYEHIGSFSHYFPTAESEKGDSCFESTSQKMEDGTIIQTLRMKNHILEPEKVDKTGVDRYEVGERTCTYTGTASSRKDLALRTALNLCNIPPLELNKFDWAKTDELLGEIVKNDQSFKEAPTYGILPIHGILMHKDKLVYGTYIYSKHKYYRKD